MNKFKTLSALNKYIATLGKTLKENEVFEIEESGQKLYYDVEKNTLIPLSKAPEGLDAVAMSVYEMNAQLIAQQPALTKEELDKASHDITCWCWDMSSRSWVDGYWMLLCNEVRYFTVFVKPHPGEDIHFANIGEAVIQCANVVGDIHAVEFNNDDIEIWIVNRQTKDINCYHFFDYSGGIATYGE